MHPFTISTVKRVLEAEGWSIEVKPFVLGSMNLECLTCRHNEAGTIFVAHLPQNSTDSTTAIIWRPNDLVDSDCERMRSLFCSVERLVWAGVLVAPAEPPSTEVEPPSEWARSCGLTASDEKEIAAMATRSERVKAIHWWSNLSLRQAVDAHDARFGR